MKMLILALPLLFWLTGSSSFELKNGAEPKANGIQWLTWEEAQQRNKTQKRKFFVDVYTDWCGWCKRMDSGTFAEKQIADFVNKNYYPIKFNAEMKEDIQFKGKVFSFVKNGGMRGYHELAAEITKGHLSYPTLVFLDEELEVIQALPGYREALEFETIITYFAKNEHKKTPWESYQKKYKPMPKD